MFFVLFEERASSTAASPPAETDLLMDPGALDSGSLVEADRWRNLQDNEFRLGTSVWRDEDGIGSWLGAAARRDRGVANAGAQHAHRLRIGTLMYDSRPSVGHEFKNTSRPTREPDHFLSFISAARPAEWAETSNPTHCAQYLGLDFYLGDQLLRWEIFESQLHAGLLGLSLIWQDADALEYYRKAGEPFNQSTHRVQHIGVSLDEVDWALR